jgi:hypothetical protein
VVDAVVIELRDIQDIIASEGIGIDDAIRPDFPQYNGHQRI